MKNFIVKSYGELDLTVTNISDQDIYIYFYNWINRYKYSGAVRELADYIDAMAGHAFGIKQLNKVYEMDEVVIFEWAGSYWCWLQAENAFDAAHRYYELFKKLYLENGRII